MRTDSLYGDGSAVPNKRKTSVSPQQTLRAKTASDALARAGQEPTMRRRMASDLSPQTQKQEQVQLKKTQAGAEKKTAMQKVVDILLGGSGDNGQNGKASALSGSNKYLEPGTLLSGATTPKEQQQQAQAQRNAETAQKAAQVVPLSSVSFHDFLDSLWDKAGKVSVNPQQVQNSHIRGANNTPVVPSVPWQQTSGDQGTDWMSPEEIQRARENHEHGLGMQDEIIAQNKAAQAAAVPLSGDDYQKKLRTIWEKKIYLARTRAFPTMRAISRVNRIP